VESYRDERLVAQGSNVRGRSLRFKSANLAELRSLYQVEVPELAELLLHLGRQLGTALPKKAAESHPQAQAGAEALPSAPPLVWQADGWMRVSLVHLTFPPYCCECGSYTGERQEYQGHAMGVRVGHMDILEAGDVARVQIPVCAGCQAVYARIRRRGVLGGVAVGVLIALLLTTALCVLIGNPGFFLLIVPFAALGALIGAGVGTGVSKAMTSPVRLRGYSASEGTMLLWFRNPAYAEALVEILGGVAEVEPEPDGSDEETGTADKAYSGR
jgi:hypothetical protein